MLDSRFSPQVTQHEDGRLDFAEKNPAQHYQTVQILLKYYLLSHNDVVTLLRCCCNGRYS